MSVKYLGLEDLTGPCELSGVDLTSIEYFDNYYGQNIEANAIRFTLNGVTYMVSEDIQDDFRSSIRNVEVSKEIVSNTFEPQNVIGAMPDSTLIFTDTTTNKTVLEIGTDYSDECYPCCVMYFAPENMAINANINPVL